MNRYELMRLMRERKEREGWIRESEDVSSEVPAEGMSAEVVKSNQRIYINLPLIDISTVISPYLSSFSPSFKLKHIV